MPSTTTALSQSLLKRGLNSYEGLFGMIKATAEWSQSLLKRGLNSYWSTITNGPMDFPSQSLLKRGLNSYPVLARNSLISFGSQSLLKRGLNSYYRDRDRLHLGRGEVAIPSKTRS